MGDVEVLSGPPWWSPRILPRYVLLILGFIALGFYTYLRIERWKMRAILDERERLAYSMHDTLAQSFAGVGFHLQGVRNGLRSRNLKLQAALEKLDVACDLVTHTHREASAEIAALHPDYTESTDILTALQRSTQVLLEGDIPHMELIRAGSPRKLSMTARDALFQIGREAISNILRHSSASAITLKLIYESRQVVLHICDNGRGFSYSEHAEDFGMRGMRHRAERTHGKLVVEASPGKGTLIKAHVPYGTRFGFSNWLQSDRASVGTRTP
jgi:signal transduction histidine kinase